jgi:hypothetical protein
MRNLKKFRQLRNKSNLEDDIKNFQLCYYYKIYDDYYYDNLMIREIFKISKSQLQKVLSRSNIEKDDIVIYKNMYLYNNQALDKLMEQLVK